MGMSGGAGSLLASPVPTLMESRQIPTNPCQVVTFDTTLIAGQQYYVLAEGTYQYAGGFDADAEWSWNDQAGTEPLGWYEVSHPAQPEDWLDLRINGAQVDWMGSPLEYLDPVANFNTFAEHTYSPTHTYWYAVVGDGNPLEVDVYDTGCGDNSGTLTLHLYGVLEARQIPTNPCQAVAFDTTLRAGQRYYLLAEGTYQYAGGFDADAEWSWTDQAGTAPLDWYEVSHPAQPEDWLDLRVNGTQVDWMGSPLESLDPIANFGDFAEHTYSPTHSYWSSFVSDGSPLEVDVYDTGCGDNSGTLAVTLYAGSESAIPAVSTWGLAVMALLMLSAGTLLCNRYRRRGPATTC